ncbi:MAG TPA: hypothetical protein VNV13_14400, partial [Steroidobacteraceae bacterium]|nr:hypothetical protein [Steroidobacteraceae bacterium]
MLREQQATMAHFVAFLFSAILIVDSFTAVAQSSGSADPVSEAVRERIEALSAGGRLSVDDADLSAVQSLPTLYELHGFKPFW